MLAQDKLILFFDTETTGFEKKGKPIEEQPHIVQLGYIVAMYDGVDTEVIESKNILLDPGVPIPEECTKIHGISDDMVRGKPKFEDIAGDFFRSAVESDLIVGHNVNYDVGVMRLEAERIWPDQAKREAWLRMVNKKLICTMQPSVDFCRIPFPSRRRGYKWPKLTELYQKLFDRDFDNAHDAFGDITATMECFVELHKRKIIHVI